MKTKVDSAQSPAWYDPPPESERTDQDRDDIDVAWTLVVRGTGTLLNSTEGHLAVLRGIRYGRASNSRP
jgi:hypothetical protein